jgi:hypothetical protein
MDQHMMRGFSDEMEKIGFSPFKFMGAGFRHLKNAVTGGRAVGATGRIGGRGADRAGGIGKHISSIYHGAGQKAGRKAMGGASGPVGPKAEGYLMGGLKGVAKSRYGQMAAAGGATGLAGYGAYRAVGGGGGGRQRQQSQQGGY